MLLIQVITEQFIQRPSLQSDSASQRGAVAQTGLCVQHAVTKELMTRVTSLGLKTLSGKPFPSVCSPAPGLSQDRERGTCHTATVLRAPQKPLEPPEGRLDTQGGPRTQTLLARRHQDTCPGNRRHSTGA